MSLLMSSPLDSPMDMGCSLASLSWVRSERFFTPPFVVHVGVCVGFVLDCGAVQERIVDCRASFSFLDCFGSPGEGSGLSSPKREFNSFLG